MKNASIGWVLTIIAAVSLPTATILLSSGRLAEKIDQIEESNDGKVDREVFNVHMENIKETQARILAKLDSIEARIQ